MKWYVNSSHTTHPDMRGHTGGSFTMGVGTIYARSTKQKLNTKSSTETELVGADDCLPQILWTNNFIKAQGYEIKNTVLYQDNRSTMLLEKNGMLSSSKRTKHINVRYYFIKDQIDKKNISIEYCPTEEMIADFFTKPLQGNLFVKFRAKIMGLE